MNEFFKKPVVKILMLKGEKGDKGNTGEGFPKGGKTGQYLQKKSNADYDFAWSPITTVSWDNVSGKTNATESAAGLLSAGDKTALDGLKTHSHGLVNQEIGTNKQIDNTYDTWNETIGDGGDVNGPMLKVFRTKNEAPEWLLDSVAPGIAFGAGDVRAVITADYSSWSWNQNASPRVRVAGCSGNNINWHADLLHSKNYTKYVKSTTKSFTLSAANWSDWTQSISDSLITATSNQEVLPAMNITADQMKALQKANIIDSGQSAGSLTLKALGTVPTIDIPIRIIFRGTI